MDELQKMVSGKEYFINDVELKKIRNKTRHKVSYYNSLSTEDEDRRRIALKSIFLSVGDSVHIENGLNVDYGINTCIGENVFINFNFICLDCAKVIIGNNVFIGPGVQVYTALHPLDPEMRRMHIGQAFPVVINNNVWIGGGSILLPGVIIGEGATIGAGSVVTRSIPANSIAYGNPCRKKASLPNFRS